jgi:hypothetical protein
MITAVRLLLVVADGRQYLGRLVIRGGGLAGRQQRRSVPLTVACIQMMSPHALLPEPDSPETTTWDTRSSGRQTITRSGVPDQHGHAVRQVLVGHPDVGAHRQGRQRQGLVRAVLGDRGHSQAT